MAIDRLKELQELAKAEPDDPFLIYALALEYIKSGSKHRAFELFNQLISEFPDYLPVYYTYGHHLAENGDFNMAKTIWLKGLKLAESLKNLKTFNELRAVLEEMDDDF